MWEMLVTQMITWAWIECYAPWQDDCIKTVQAEAYWFYLCYSRRSSKLYFQPVLIFKCAMNFLFKDEKHHAIPVKYSIFSFLILVSVFLRGYHYCRQIYKATSKQRMHEQHLGTPLQTKSYRCQHKELCSKQDAEHTCYHSQDRDNYCFIKSLDLRNLFLHLWFSGHASWVKRITAFTAQIKAIIYEVHMVVRKYNTSM